MVTKSDIVTTFNGVFESSKEYKDLSIYEKLYSLLLLTASGSNGSTSDTIKIRDKTSSTNELVIDSEGKIGINNLTALAKTVDITALGTKLDNILTELDTKANLTDTQPVSLSTIPLATNAATSTNQTTANNSLASIDTKLTTINTRVLTSTDVVSSVQSGTWNLANITGTISLPTGAATESTLSSLSSKLPSVLVSDRLKVTAIFDTAQPITIATLPSLATGTNAIGSITNTGFKVINGANELAINGSGQLTISNSSFNIGNFPSNQTVSGTVSISNSFALDSTVTGISNKLPSTLGTNTAANSFPVTLSNDGTFSTAFGLATDSAASSDTASTGFISLVKRLLQKLTTGISTTVSNLVPSVGISGSKNITTASTFETLTSSNTLSSGIYVQAKTTNTGLITVRYTGTTDGVVLEKGNSLFFAIDNSNKLEVATNTNGEGLRWWGS